MLYLVETLHITNLEKLKKFCGGKFSILTTYKIGIELLQCLKYIHKAGYIYLNIKGDNISLLYESIKKSKFINHITIINYCFCTKYIENDNLLLPKEKAPRINENLYYSSVNSLSDKPVSYKDDILAMCYYLIYLYKRKLRWHALSGDNKDKKKIYPNKK